MRSKRRRHCIDGTCHKAGCDHRLGSEMNSRRLRCLCTFGYNEVLRIPAGAAGIDITQTAHNGQKEDDNYLALRTFTGEFLLNGQYQVPLFRQQIPILDTVLEYSGSDCGGVDKRHRTIAFRHLPSRVSVRWCFSNSSMTATVQGPNGQITKIANGRGLPHLLLHNRLPRFVAVKTPRQPIYSGNLRMFCAVCSCRRCAAPHDKIYWTVNRFGPETMRSSWHAVGSRRFFLWSTRPCSAAVVSDTAPSLQSALPSADSFPLILFHFHQIFTALKKMLANWSFVGVLIGQFGHAKNNAWAG
uniref:Caspase family p10 domain-containing protein n=1 Tax=Globodera rostochiensis TaxID=31243 RepID=A0A914I8S7_GLORO